MIYENMTNAESVAWRPDKPHNQLPPLPPPQELESRAALKACITARAALAELKQAAELIPNQTMLFNTIPLLEAKDSSEIENIVTTTDKLFQRAQTDRHGQAAPATKEVLRYRSALHRGYQSLKERPLCTATAVEICRTLKAVNMDIRKTPGTQLENDKTGEIIYTPPEGEALLRDMLANWERFIHNEVDIDPLIRMAVAHYQFEAIHPFSDGNGRTGRVINILFLILQTMAPLIPNSGRPYSPVVTLNGWTLPWRMSQGVKEFHLVAEPVVREMAPGFKTHLWGYNGQSPGPTIEVVVGDRVRIFVTNKLPEYTSIHWHDKVRIRIGNLTMTNHPIHLHGHEFLVTGTDRGPTPKSTRWYEVTTDVAVGQMRQIEFLADEEGDWAFHCHKSHHTMNAMGHNVPTLIGVDHSEIAKKINKLIPDYMVMGERGMAEMEMPLPENTAAMMTGDGPFGSVEMGGMFSVVKVRKNQKPGDYKDPGWFKHPDGTVAHEYTGPLTEPARFKAEGGQSMPRTQKPEASTKVRVRKPGSHSSH